MDDSCLMRAWRRHEGELRGYLRRRMRDSTTADDLLQNVFLKALAQGPRFCALDNARAWLFQVTRNALADHLRLARDSLELPDDLVQDTDDPLPVDTLVDCLPRALAELPLEDRDALIRCDLDGMRQADYARLTGLTLAGAKSRVQRARKRLRAHLTTQCQVRFDGAGKVCCFVPRAAAIPPRR